MKLLKLFILFIITSTSAIAGIEDLKSVHLMKNKYGKNCIQERNKIINQAQNESIEKIEEVIWSIQNEILQEGIIRARDLDLKDLVIVWIKKFGVDKIKTNPNLLFLKLGVHKRYIHSFRMALEEIEGVTIHPEIDRVSQILKS
tara:strand:+ start:457 stop:888 length:432 start_codon:yes stop_codon:yes gene_type:complete